jgi:hypothetical protein
MVCPGPTEGGFITFLRQFAGIPTGALPDNSPVIPVAFTVALGTVYRVLQRVNPEIYNLAVYNLGTSIILNWAPDVPNAPTLPVGDKNLPYFAAMRANLGINNFTAGVIQNSFDNSTGAGWLVPDQLKSLTLANLQQLKDPYGRQYLAWAQSAGSLWGRS